MPAPSPSLQLDAGLVPDTGKAVSVAPGLLRVTAPNSGPYTFTGTNSFLFGETQLVLVDPGPNDPSHVEALMTAVAGRVVKAILLTHTHRDHCDLARTMAERLNAPLWFGGPHRLSRPARRGEINAVARSSDWDISPDRALFHGEVLDIAGTEMHVIATPGHCANHLAFGLPAQDILLSGDHVMAWSSTLVSVPDGSMRDYLASLDRVIAAPFQHYHPAHGGPIADGRAHAAALKAHRLSRNTQILKALDDGARTIGAIVRKVYPGVALTLLPAARMTVGAHVEYLETEGRLALMRGPFGRRIIVPIARVTSTGR